MLLVTACPWTARATAASLAGAGLATVRAPDLDVALALCTTGVCDALLVDERLDADGAGRGTGPCRTLIKAVPVPPLPVMVLVRDVVTSHEHDALFAAGVWGTAPYPLGGSAWVGQLATWTRASVAARHRLEDGLVDVVTGLYNARGLEQRATELDATARRSGGALACAVFGVEAAPLRAATAWGSGPADQANDPATMPRRVADACRRVGRAADVFARLGDAQFAVIAPGADAAGARMLVGRITDALGDVAERPRLRVGICAVPEARTATLSVGEMLAHAASRA